MLVCAMHRKRGHSRLRTRHTLKFVYQLNIFRTKLEQAHTHTQQKFMLNVLPIRIHEIIRTIFYWQKYYYCTPKMTRTTQTRHAHTHARRCHERLQENVARNWRWCIRWLGDVVLYETMSRGEWLAFPSKSVPSIWVCKHSSFPHISVHSHNYSAHPTHDVPSTEPCTAIKCWTCTHKCLWGICLLKSLRILTNEPLRCEIVCRTTPSTPTLQSRSPQKVGIHLSILFRCSFTRQHSHQIGLNGLAPWITSMRLWCTCSCSGRLHGRTYIRFIYPSRETNWFVTRSILNVLIHFDSASWSSVNIERLEKMNVEPYYICFRLSSFSVWPILLICFFVFHRTFQMWLIAQLLAASEWIQAYEICGTGGDGAHN